VIGIGIDCACACACEEEEVEDEDEGLVDLLIFVILANGSNGPLFDYFLLAELVLDEVIGFEEEEEY